MGKGKAHTFRLVDGLGAMSTTLKSQTTCADKYTTARTRAISKVRSSRLAQRDIQNGPYIATKYRPHARPNNDTTAITAQTMSSLCMARRVSKRASGPRTTALQRRPDPLLAVTSWTTGPPLAPGDVSVPILGSSGSEPFTLHLSGSPKWHGEQRSLP